MARIAILPEDLISKIAAGEVVERPSSVLKEFVENSLDADSRKIVCAADDGGKGLLSVTDDGTGMSREDALLAVQRHATSKLAVLDDLLDVSTFGFRGEALPSIASVSKMEIITRTREDMAGTRILIHGGNVVLVDEIGCPPGTSVMVRELFYNVPARRKFLRTTQTELHHLVSTITSLSLSNPGAAFSLSHEGHVLLEFPAVASDRDRALAVLGLGFVKTAAELEIENELARVAGFVSNPENLSATRTRQFVFVNGRPVTSRSLVHAVYHGFGLEKRDRHPTFVLMVQVPRDRIDVNVHPTKREIRLIDEKAVHDLVTQAVKNAIRPAGEAKRWIEPLKGPGSSFFGERLGAGVQESLLPYGQKEPPAGEEKTIALVPEFWQLHRTYIIAQTKTGMIIVDQHTAHERVIYEQILKNRKGAESQQLLFPRTLELPPQEAALLEEKMDEVLRLGFDVKKFSGGTYVIEAVPAYLTNYRDETFVEFVHEMYEAGRAKIKSFEEIAKALACKAAIKAGQTLSPEEMNSLVDRLFATSVPFFCPHGRPTVVRMSMEELGRRFGRI
jgi:DNA mismatch repair protein MutL